MTELEIKNLHVSVGMKEIVKGLNLMVKAGEVHAIMGPNGSGKSTLSFAIMGHPRYSVTNGNITVNGEDITDKTADLRAKAGLFLGFQYPFEVAGVNFSNFIRTAYRSVNKTSPVIFEFQKMMDEHARKLGIEHVSKRYLNDGFSGGEKKKGEMLQMQMLSPKIAILDEIDSGLDIDSLKTVAATIKEHVANGGSVLIITHYRRILDHLKPDYVHVMIDGKIAMSGDSTLPGKLEEKGYSWLKEIEE